MQIKIFVPTHDKPYITRLENVLSEIFGGCTTYNQCKGTWYNKGIIHNDDITVIEIFTNKVLNETDFWGILSRINLELNQKCIAYSLDNEIHFW